VIVSENGRMLASVAICSAARLGIRQALSGANKARQEAENMCYILGSVGHQRFTLSRWLGLWRQAWRPPHLIIDDR
jgi:hypothetical protein